VNNSWARRHSWDCLWSLPRDLNRRFEQALCYCEVGSLTRDKWSKAAAGKRVLSYERRLMNVSTSRIKRVRKVGFTVMIQKQSSNRRSGGAHNHQEQRRRGRCGVQQRACSFFSTWRRLFTVNLLLLIMVNSDFYLYCDGLRHLREMQWKNRNFGATVTGSITTCPPTHPWKPQFVTNTMVIVTCSPYLPGLPPVISLCFLNWKWNWRNDIWNSDIKGNLKWYLTALRKVTSAVLLKHGKNDGITVLCSQGDYFEGDGSQIWVRNASIYCPSLGTFRYTSSVDFVSSSS
jgi:hypothetical protein